MKTNTKIQALLVGLTLSLLTLWERGQTRLRDGKEAGNNTLELVIWGGIIAVVVVGLALKFTGVLDSWFGKIPNP